MKKKLMALIFCVGVFTFANAAEPYIKKVEKKIDIDGKKYLKTDRKIYFPGGNFYFVTTREEGQKKLYCKKWGNYFLGLQFGRPKNSNGSWSLWEFIKSYSKIDNQYKNVFKLYEPENIYVSQINDITVAEIISPLSEDDSKGKVSLKMMKFPAYPNWVFIKLKYINASYTPWRIDLSAYPGNSNNPKERERWIGTRENKYCVAKEMKKFKPQTPGLVMFSKFVHENFGNYLVYEPAKYKLIDIPRAGAGVSVRLYTVKGQSEFKFALGYFMDKPAADVLPRFLGETQDNISKFLEKIDWEPKLESKEFDKLAADTDKLIKDTESMGIDCKKFKASLDAASKAYQAAVKANDMKKASIEIEKIKKIKKDISNAAMSQFN